MSGIVNTLVADPIKLFTKEDFVPPGADKLLHTLAPIVAVVPALITMLVVPFGDVLRAGRSSDRITGGASQRRYSLHPGDGFAWGVRHRARRLGFQQPLGTC